MSTIAIIQARMGSTRLPGKVLKPLGKSIVLDYVVSRTRLITGVDRVIVATSQSTKDKPIVQWCKQNHIDFFCGSETDVLDRYYQCAKQYNPDYVIRVTADCPFLDYHLGSQIVAKMYERPSDIVVIKGILPRGLNVEMVSMETLTHIHQNGTESYHREHVTYYAYEHLYKFSSLEITPPSYLLHPQLRITLDTAEDYQLMKHIANHFIQNKLVSSEEVIKYLLDHPEIANINAHIKQKPVK